MSVYSDIHYRQQPVFILAKGDVRGIPPVDGVVQKLAVGVKILSDDRVGDGPCKLVVSCFGVESSLRFTGVLGSDEPTKEGTLDEQYKD